MFLLTARQEIVQDTIRRKQLQAVVGWMHR